VSFGPGPLFSRASVGRFRVFDARTCAPRGELVDAFAPAGLAWSPVSATAAVPSVFLDGYSLVNLPPRRAPRPQ
jgi:hypothetical protein